MLTLNIFCDPSGGSGNTVAANTSFLGGGAENCIMSNASFASNFNVLGGGQQNAIDPGATHSSIFSGHKNCVAGNCSAILGGANNSDGGLNNVFIAGSGITASLPNMLYAILRKG